MLEQEFKLHKRWWLKAHSADSAYISALGLFKALRNYVNPAMKGKEPSVEALGDAILYCFSVCHCNGWDAPECISWQFEGAQELGKVFALVVRNFNSSSSLRSAFSVAVAGCRHHGYEPTNVVALAMRKLK